MASLVNLSDYLNAKTSNPDDLWFQRNGTVGNTAITTAIAGYEQSLWVCDGIPCLGAAVSSVAVPTNATIGSMQQADPGGGRQKWLTAFEAFTSVNSVSTISTGILNLYDRLLHVGGLSGTNTNPAILQGNTGSGTCTISNASPAIVSKTAHGYARGQKIQFTTTGTLPTGLSLATDYFVINAGFSADQFEVSATLGGSAINTSSNGSGTHTATGTLSATLTRYTDGLGNEIWLEIQTLVGATPTTVTASYTNESGATHTTQAVTFGGTNYREKTRIIRLPLAAGDKGVTAVDQYVIAGSTGTAGDFAAMVVHPIASLEIVNGGISAMRSFIYGQPGPIEILTGACLALSYLARSTSTVNVTGCLHMVEK